MLGFSSFPMKMAYIRMLVWVFLWANLAGAQQPSTEKPAAPSEAPYYHDWKAELDESGIHDNSFLVEEAYNQEHGVVQHINNFIYLAQTKSWAYSFTQEWP